MCLNILSALFAGDLDIYTAHVLRYFVIYSMQVYDLYLYLYDIQVYSFYLV